MAIRLWLKDYEKKDHISKREKGILRFASSNFKNGHFAVGIDPLGLSTDTVRLTSKKTLINEFNHFEGSALAESANVVLENIKRGDIIKFINGHIEEIFTIENHVYDIRSVTLEFIKQYITGIKQQVYSFLCEKFSWLIIDDFDSFYKVIREDNKLFEKLYPTGNLDEIQNIRSTKTLGIFEGILTGNHEALKKLVNERVSVLCTDVEALISSLTTDNVMQYEGTIREFTYFLQRVSHPKANNAIAV